MESSYAVQPQRISYISKEKKHVVNKVNATKMKKLENNLFPSLLSKIQHML